MELFAFSVTARYVIQILCLSSVAIAGWSLKPALADAACSDPVGRIYQTNNSGAPKGKMICVGERLQLVQSSAIPSIQIFCFATGQYKVFSYEQIISDTKGCESPKQARPLRLCVSGDPDAIVCNTPKGTTSETTELRLIQPYGRAVLTTPQVLGWLPIVNANHYLVQIEGKGVQWQQTVVQSSVLYPAELQWQFGSAYTITIAAYTNRGDLISARQTVLNRLPQQAAQEIAARSTQIQQLNLPNPDEVAVFDLTSLYLSHGLLNEAIRVLTARVQANSENPMIYRVLGDLYLAAGAPRFAKPFYEQALALADRKDQETERINARSGLAALQQIPPNYYRF